VTRQRRRAALIVGLVALVVVGAGLVVRQKMFGPKTITAYFTSTTAVYPGDDVRVLGVKVGRIDSIQPDGTQAKMTMTVDHSVAIPADAAAVIVAENLVAARYVQLTPAYQSSGPTMADGATIPISRTAVPVEWDQVKTQLTRLATDLGPSSDVSGTSVGRFIDSAANALDGNGGKLRQTLTELSGVGRILGDGSGNIVDIITNLQIFIAALSKSNTQIVQFQDRLATLSSVLDDSRSDMDAALTNLTVAVAEVQRFIAGSRNQAAEQIQRLANVTQNLVDNRVSLENILHVSPTAIANGHNIYNPDTGAPAGELVFNNLSNPTQFICGAIGAVENVSGVESAKLCAQYLGPALHLFNFNYLPLPLNPFLMKSADPENIIYTEPGLAPGGAGGKPSPPEIPPAVSAYTGFPDNPNPLPVEVPPPFPPGPTAPDHLPAFPSPALFPGAPVPAGPPVPVALAPAPPPAASTLPELLLPAERLPQPGGPPPSQPLPVEGTPPS